MTRFFTSRTPGVEGDLLVMVWILRRCDGKWFFFKTYKIEGDVSSRLVNVLWFKVRVPGSLRSRYEIISKKKRLFITKLFILPFLSPRTIGCCSRVQSCPTLNSNWTLSHYMNAFCKSNPELWRRRTSHFRINVLDLQQLGLVSICSVFPQGTALVLTMVLW